MKMPLLNKISKNKKGIGVIWGVVIGFLFLAIGIAVAAYLIVFVTSSAEAPIQQLLCEGFIAFMEFLEKQEDKGDITADSLQWFTPITCQRVEGLELPLEGNDRNAIMQEIGIMIGQTWNTFGRIPPGSFDKIFASLGSKHGCFIAYEFGIRPTDEFSEDDYIDKAELTNFLKTTPYRPLSHIEYELSCNDGIDNDRDGKKDEEDTLDCKEGRALHTDICEKNGGKCSATGFDIAGAAGATESQQAQQATPSFPIPSSDGTVKDVSDEDAHSLYSGWFCKAPKKCYVQNKYWVTFDQFVKGANPKQTQGSVRSLPSPGNTDPSVLKTGIRYGIAIVSPTHRFNSILTTGNLNVENPYVVLAEIKYLHETCDVQLGSVEA